MTPPGDNRKKHRTVQMDVLVLGLCRTGTMSMKFALEELGYRNVYHMSSIFDDESHAKMWIEALKVKFGDAQGNRLTAVFWDRIVGDYSALTDIPAACFSEELIAAYPDAKVILTTRTPSSWYRSMIRTIHSLQTSPLDRFLVLFASPYIKLVSRVMDLIVEHYFEGSISEHGERVFESHNELVRNTAACQQRDFLEFQIGDGWRPLCEFLGKAEPEMDFPHVNDAKSFRAAFKLDLSRNIIIASGIIAIIAVLRAILISS